MRPFRRLAGIPALLLATSCGGGSAPTSAAASVATATPSHAVSVIAYYDQNADGIRDAADISRLGGVTIDAGGTTAATAHATGRATLSAVPAGMQVFRVLTSSLPPYFQARDLAASVPANGDLELPLVLPIGSNQPGRYLALGDSITLGDGSSNGKGYEPLLQDMLRAEWGQAEVLNDGIDGNKTFQGAERISGDLAYARPACVLILLGTNDWNKCKDVDSCYTQDSVRSMLEQAKAARSLPFLATIIPANPEYPDAVPPQRNEWVAAMNERLKVIAAQQGVPVVDLFGAFERAAAGDLSRLFSDHVHPNDRGHEIIAAEFFKALVSPRATLAAGAAIDRGLLLRNPAGGLDLDLPDDGLPLSRTPLAPLVITPLPSSLH